MKAAKLYLPIMKNGIRTIALRGKLFSQLGLGFGSRSGLVLGFGATRQLPPKKIAPRLGLGFGLGLVWGLEAIFLGGNCPKTLLKNSNPVEFFRSYLTNWLIGQLPPRKIAPNPKTNPKPNPNPNRLLPAL